MITVFFYINWSIMDFVVFHRGLSWAHYFSYFIYVNDMTYTSDVPDFILFADDTAIAYSHKDINNLMDLVNKELKEVRD